MKVTESVVFDIARIGAAAMLVIIVGKVIFTSNNVPIVGPLWAMA